MAGWGPKFQDQPKSAFDSVNQHMYDHMKLPEKLPKVDFDQIGSPL